MSNLQELIYKQLPQSVKSEIYNNPEEHPEYNYVISELNKNLLSSYKSKVKLTKKDIILMSILLNVYYHIKKHPPRKKKSINYTVKAWLDFMRTNYPFYDEDNIDKWTKFMWVLYNTYKISYREYYNLKQVEFLVNDQLIPRYNGEKQKFISYIYFIYKYLDKTFTKEDLDYMGY
jgi:hypothetical protein